jgi:hypothetical protein
MICQLTEYIDRTSFTEATGDLIIPGPDAAGHRAGGQTRSNL